MLQDRLLCAKVCLFRIPLGNYGEGSLEGKASGYGFNAGIYFKATEKLSIGFDYRSQVNVKC
jgi:long-subunit fatty acid transport protein